MVQHSKVQGIYLMNTREENGFIDDVDDRENILT